MSTREKILRTIDFLSDEQLNALYGLLAAFCPEELINEETLTAFDEIEDMKRNPENYKGYTDLNELFEELRK